VEEDTWQKRIAHKKAPATGANSNAEKGKIKVRTHGS
jgi:hypothetical protein